MSDERLRALERKFKETADPEDEEKWEAEAERAGLVPVGYLSGIVNEHYPDDGIHFEIPATVTLDGKHNHIHLEQLLEKDVNDFVYANKYLHFLTDSHSQPTIISIGPSDELPPHIPLNEHMRAPRKIRDLPRTKHSVYKQRAPMNSYNIIAVKDRPRIVAFVPGAPLRTRLLPRGRLIEGTICAFFNSTYLAIWHGDERGYFETTQSKAKRKIPQCGGACYIENDQARFCAPDDEPGSGYGRPLAFEGERPREIPEASVFTPLSNIPVPWNSRIERGELYAPGHQNLATLFNNGGFPAIREIPRKTLKALLEAAKND